MATQESLNTVEELYIAFYQRPADPEGLEYWAEKLDEANGNLDEIIDSFSNSPEAQALYGEIDSDTIVDVITAMYEAAFGRAPDAGGLQYYVDGFEEGIFTPSTILVNILDGAVNHDAEVLNEKLETALEFTKSLDEDGDGHIDDSIVYNRENVEEVRDFLSEVGLESGEESEESLDDLLSSMKELADSMFGSDKDDSSKEEKDGQHDDSENGEESQEDGTEGDEESDGKADDEEGTEVGVGFGDDNGGAHAGFGDDGADAGVTVPLLGDVGGDASSEDGGSFDFHY